MARHSIRNYSEHEGAIRQVLDSMQKVSLLLYGRFPDSKMAGNLIQQAPSDFWILYEGRMIFLEAKFSEKVPSLKGCFSGSVKGHQLATARLAERAGGKYFFAFYSVATGQHELWPGLYCANRRVSGRSLEAHHCALRTPDIEVLVQTALMLTPYSSEVANG